MQLQTKVVSQKKLRNYLKLNMTDYFGDGDVMRSMFDTILSVIAAEF